MLASMLLIGASAEPTPTPAAQALSIVCPATPLWLFGKGDNAPIRSTAAPATLGSRLRLLSGPRTTLEGDQYYETDVVAIEPGYAGRHYWVARACAIPTRSPR